MGNAAGLARQVDLRRELKLTDLALFQIVYVLGPTSIGTAAVLGRSHTIYWLAAILLFYVPQATLVIHLSGRWPLEGGLYQWIKLAYNERLGFLVAWNMWLSNLIICSYAGVTIVNHVVYALGPGGQWINESEPINIAVSAGVLGIIGALGIRGLEVGKWVHNAGGASIVLCYLLLLALPIASGAPRPYAPVTWELPVLSLLSLNVLSKLTVPALCGLEQAAVLAGECSQPARDLRRATLIAGPCIALMFMLGTGAVISFVAPGKVDLAAPFPQAIAAAAARLRLSIPVVPIVCGGLILYWFSGASSAFTALSRLPMVAGWDHLLPAWFTRLHPVWKTPVNSILATLLLAIGITLYSIAGAGHQEAFQILLSQTNVFTALAYLPMFALPLLRGPSSWPLRLAGAAGLSSTLLFILLALQPLVQVRSAWVFAAKVAGVIAAANLGGLLVFAMADRTAQRPAPPFPGGGPPSS